jgi:hypothetical protein
VYGGGSGEAEGGGRAVKEKGMWMHRHMHRGALRIRDRYQIACIQGGID